MIIIGIDPGTAETGVGIINTGGGHLKLVELSCIKTKVSVPKPLRLQQIFEGILAKATKFKAQALAIEKLFFNSNAKSASAVGQAMGAAMLAAARCKIPVFEYSPLSVKKQLTGYGRAKKPQLQRAVRKVLRIRAIPRPQHAADALAVAICHFMITSKQ